MTLAVVPGPLYVGYVWTVGVRLYQPLPSGADSCAPRQPINVAADWTLWADFFSAPGAAPQRIALTSVVVAQARGLLVVPKSITGDLTAQKPSETTYPVHALLGYTDGPNGADHALGPVFFLPLDPSAAGVGP